MPNSHHTSYVPAVLNYLDIYIFFNIFVYTATYRFSPYPSKTITRIVIRPLIAAAIHLAQ